MKHSTCRHSKSLRDFAFRHFWRQRWRTPAQGSMKGFFVINTIRQPGQNLNTQLTLTCMAYIPLVVLKTKNDPNSMITVCCKHEEMALILVDEDDFSCILILSSKACSLMTFYILSQNSLVFYPWMEDSSVSHWYC